MSSIKGGIFGNPSGSTGNIVFGAARTREGKVTTARQKVNPSNPKTSAQVTQRNKFSSVLDLVRRIGKPIYGTDWNRAIGQLPGYQSIQSTYLNQIDSSLDINLTLPVNLGTLPGFENFSVTSGSPGVINITWNDNSGGSATSADVATFLLVASTDANRQTDDGVITSQTTTRSSTSVSFLGLTSGVEYQIYYYYKGEGLASGLYSIAEPASITVSS